MSELQLELILFLAILAGIALYKTGQALGELWRELYRIERVMRKIEEIK